MDWMMPLIHISGAAYYRLCELLCTFWAPNRHLGVYYGPKMCTIGAKFYTGSPEMCKWITDDIFW
jgi:hypothetical protein